MYFNYSLLILIILKYDLIPLFFRDKGSLIFV